MAMEFDRTEAERVVLDVIARRFGEVGTVAFESVEPGVVAVERQELRSTEEWEAAAAEISETLGVDVVSVHNCDWQAEDDSDDEATAIAFDVPDLDESYRAPPNNRIAPRHRAPRP